MEYDFKNIENKWQQRWEQSEIFHAKIDKSKSKYYALCEFPYPSGEGLHVGHPRGYTAMDIIARYKRLKGYSVLFPFGWDAFGLPTENYAIQNNIHPKIATENNIERFRKQSKMLGFSFDWSREINTTNPDYYKWTQWIFIKLFKKGLAYKAKIPINWCTSCNVGLANEEVVNNLCERCGGSVKQKEKSQWMLKITDYADKLIDGLNSVSFLDKIKQQQLNWIGKSQGVSITFKIKKSDESLEVFTTRPDTIFGVTYLVISPEHPLIKNSFKEIKNQEEIQQYIQDISHKTEFERVELNFDKTGVQLIGMEAIHPIHGKNIPIWISDYVLMCYGTGAVMAVPAHDQRDYDFAKKYCLPIIEVISGGDITKKSYIKMDNGVLKNSDFLNGLTVSKAIEQITTWMENQKIGKATVNYKLRDWVFSRQRYWGEPIPIVTCPSCNHVPIDESELPLVLPEITNYKTTESGDSPLANLSEWINVKCPLCGKNATRETDTMPQWAGSSWYYLRYLGTELANKIFDPDEEKYWMPVDWYNGGMEHTTLHLLYSRFWHKFLYDEGYVSTPEPYLIRTSHGMVLGSNGEKMSKSRGNVLNPDNIVEEFGADTLRLYEMFMGAFDQSIPWNANQISGVHRFLKKVWNLFEKIDYISNDQDSSLIHQTIKKVEDDIISMKFNTAIAQLMILANYFSEQEKVSKNEYQIFLILLSVFSPHICEEIWEKLGNQESIQKASWPIFDINKIEAILKELPITFNGKLKTTISVPLGLCESEAKKIVHDHPMVKKILSASKIIKEIYVVDKVYNFVVKK